MTQNQLGWATLTENKRHNIVSEGVSSGSLAESYRHNLATEAVSRGQLDVGRSQAQASLMGASAAQTQAATAAGRLAFDRYQYDNTGADYTRSQTNLNDWLSNTEIYKGEKARHDANIRGNDEALYVMDKSFDYTGKMVNMLGSLIGSFIPGIKVKGAK